MTTQSTPSKQTVREVLKELLADLVRFGRAEFNLIKAEGLAAARHGIGAVAFFTVTLVFLLLFAIFALGAAAEAIGGWLHHPWLGWLIMAGAFLVVGALFGLIGYRKLKRAIREGKNVPAIVKEDLEWVRQLPKRNESES
jgi:Na+/melibiose symporter-like transporter